MVKTTQQFIEEAIAVHGDAYDYSKTEYKNNKAKVIIICKKCNNEFLQTPGQHIIGKSCNNCRYNSMRFTKEQVIEKAKKIYGENKYNFTPFYISNADFSRQKNIKCVKSIVGIPPTMVLFFLLPFYKKK
jgi:hypothetical protein